VATWTSPWEIRRHIERFAADVRERIDKLL